MFDVQNHIMTLETVIVNHRFSPKDGYFPKNGSEVVKGW